MRLEVDPAGYDGAAGALLVSNQVVASGYESLTSRLAGYAAMGGDDTSSEEFVANYDGSAREVVGGISDLVAALGTLATVTDASGANHRDANAGSVYRSSAAGTSGRGEITPDQVAEFSPPSALGGDSGDMPEFWDLIVDHLQGWAWPSADTNRLREAASTWRDMGALLDRVPPHLQEATDGLSAQRSPEIVNAMTAFVDVEQAVNDLSTECRNLADSCEEYAQKVDTTKDVVIGLLKDLAIEIGATAVISGLASLVTFGGAAAVGASVAIARAVSCARKIITALQGIRAIRAIGVMVRTIDKATDVRFLLRRFRSARALRHRPTGHLPEIGRPHSYGYDGAGDRLPYTNSRPSYGDGQVDEVWRGAQGADGDVWVQDKSGRLVKIEWEPGQPRRDVWDMGHASGREYRDLRDEYLSGRIDKDEFLARYRDPDNYSVQHPGRNRSHVDELAR